MGGRIREVVQQCLRLEVQLGVAGMEESNGFKVYDRRFDSGADYHSWSTLTVQKSIKRG